MSITTKLFAVQQEIGKISKDATNPFYKSKYFDINSLIEQTIPLFKKHGILLLQPIRNGEVYTILRCTETETQEESSIPLPEMSDPQKVGSAITYFRRYNLASMLGLQAQDDDGNATVGSVVDNRPFLTQEGLDYVLNGTKEDAIKAMQTRRMKTEYKRLIQKKHGI